MTSVEHDPTVPTAGGNQVTSPTHDGIFVDTEFKPGTSKVNSGKLMLLPDDGIKVLPAGQIEHGGKFYFLRAFWTTMGILLSWTVWVLIPIAVATVVILLAGGLGAVMPDEDPIGEPGSDFSLACDPATELC